MESDARPVGAYRSPTSIGSITWYREGPNVRFSKRPIEVKCFRTIRDMKHPGDKIGNNVYCELPPEALAIVTSIPRVKAEIFPYSTDAISAAFTRACKILGIDDLRFHDLRHEGISRLFEMGRTIPQAAAVSGHRSWTSLKRYSHIRQSGDKYDNWRWKAVVTAPPVDARFTI